MPDLRKLYSQHKDLSEDSQKEAGKAIAGKMSDDNEAFLKTLLALIEKKEIVASDTRSFLNLKVYDELKPAEQDHINLALMNLGHLLEDIVEFRLSKETPDSSPHLETMITQLLHMKTKIEEKAGDVFKF